MKKLSKEEIKEIKSLYRLFPKFVKVRITSCEEGGYTAEVLEPEFLDGVITEGKTLSELLEMINDAIYLVLDIPERFYPYMPPYIAPISLYENLGLLPSTKIKQDISKLSIPRLSTPCPV